MPFDPRRHPRWPRGAPDDTSGDGQGGRFAEAGDLAGSIVGNLHGVTTGPWQQRASDQIGARRGEHPRMQYNAQIVDAGQRQLADNQIDQYQDDELRDLVAEFNVAQARGDVTGQDDAADRLRGHLEGVYPAQYGGGLPLIPERREAPRSPQQDQRNRQALASGRQIQERIKAGNNGDPDEGLAIRIERLEREQGRTGRNVEADRAAADLERYILEDPEGLIAAHAHVPPPARQPEPQQDGEERSAEQVGRLVDSGRQVEMLGRRGWGLITSHETNPRDDEHIFTQAGDPEPIYMGSQDPVAVRLHGPMGRPEPRQVDGGEQAAYEIRQENDDYDELIHSTAVGLLGNLADQGDQGEPNYRRLQDLIHGYEEARTNPLDPESIDTAADELANELADYDLDLPEPPPIPLYAAYPHIVFGSRSPNPTSPDFGVPGDDETAIRASQIVNVIQSSPPGSFEIQDNSGGYSPIVRAYHERGDAWFVTQNGNEVARTPDQWVRYRQIDNEPPPAAGGVGASIGHPDLDVLDARDLRDLAIEYDPNGQVSFTSAELENSPVLRAQVIGQIARARAADITAEPTQRQVNPRDETNRALVFQRQDNDRYNSGVFERAKQVAQENIGVADEEDEGIARLREMMQTYRDASTNPNDPESVDAAIDDLVDELADWDIYFDSTGAQIQGDIHDATAPERPNYHVPGGPLPVGYQGPTLPEVSGLPRRTALPDLEPGQTLAEVLQTDRGSAYGSQRDNGIPPRYRQAIHDIYDYTDSRTGLRAEVNDAETNIGGGQVHLKGKIYDRDGNPVGNFTRVIGYGGPTGVRHSLFKLQAGEQGGGFTTRWFEQVKQQYRDQGMTYITVGANLDVGGYAWAKIGFDFENRYDARRLLERVERTGTVKLAVGELSDETMAEWEALQRRYDAGEWITPLEISQVGWRQRNRDEFDGYPRTTDSGDVIEMWLGKYVMLGSSWDGKLTL